MRALPRIRPARLVVLAALLLAAAAPPPAHALRVVTWNLFQYPSGTLATRQPHFRTVMAAINADVLITQEINSAAGRDSFLNNVLNVVEPGQWSGTWLSVGAGEGMAFFWKPAKVSLGSFGSIATGGPRTVMLALATPVGYSSPTATFRLYSFHLKAGQSDTLTRRIECTNLRNSLNTAPAGTNFLVGGDSNFYGATEGGYIRLTESQADNDGRCKDPLLMPGVWHSNSGFALYMTQCPCNTGCLPGFSGGGMDDRFDLLFSSYSMADGQGLDVETVWPNYAAFGNDGQHFNTDINGGGFNNAVGITVANALHDASDHLPVVITVKLPAKLLAASQLDFGSVIVGAVAQQTLNVADGATPPADALDYSLAAPAGFTAPGGSFSAAAGAAGNDHAIGMDTGSAGTPSGTLTVSSDDPDSTSKPVLLSGTVLRHAVPSLDSVAVLASDSLDFGDHEIGVFADGAARVHNRDYDALQARLSVTAGVIGGGGGRFSIVGGFSAALLAGVGKTWNVHFDDAGATLDSTYEATLTFSSADEALPGATSAPDLLVHLRARPVAGTSAVPPGSPIAFRFDPPRPNPFFGGTQFHFELPQAAPVSLEIFDLGGRRVASLADGVRGPGRYDLRWAATRDRGGRVPAGLYFARFDTPGFTRTVRVILLP